MTRLVASTLKIKDLVAKVEDEGSDEKEKVDMDPYITMKFRGMRARPISMDHLYLFHERRGCAGIRVPLTHSNLISLIAKTRISYTSLDVYRPKCG